MSNELEIVKCYGTTNTTPKANRKIDFIIIHYTAGTSSATGWAKSLAEAYQKGQLAASSDFTVDDTTVVQYNGDIENRYTWGVGATPYPKMSTSIGGEYCGKAYNYNSINIEVCSNKTNKKSLKAEDLDWYFTEAEINLTAQLVKYLMDKYKININHVIMHHQVTGKLCPAMWCHNEASLRKWYDFKQKVLNTKDPDVKPDTPVPTPTNKYPIPPFLVTVKVKMNIRKGPTTQAPVVSIINPSVYTIVKIENGDWGKLKSGAGYIYLGNSNYVTIGKSLAQQVIVIANALNVRESTSTISKVLKVVHKNDKLTITETKDGWMKLSSGGWVFSSYVKAV